MEPLGVLKTEDNVYKVTMIEDGHTKMGKPRVPIKVFEKDSSGGWSHLETLDGEKASADKDKAFTRRKSHSRAWQDAIETIRFYDESEIVDERRKF